MYNVRQLTITNDLQTKQVSRCMYLTFHIRVNYSGSMHTTVNSWLTYHHSVHMSVIYHNKASALEFQDIYMSSLLLSLK